MNNKRSFPVAPYASKTPSFRRSKNISHPPLRGPTARCTARRIGSAVRRLEHLEIIKPRTRIELGVDRVDKKGLSRLPAIERRLDDDDTRHLLLRSRRRWGRAWIGCRRPPAKSDSLTIVPDVEELEGDVWLVTLATFKGGEGVEGCGAEGFEG